MCSQWYESSSHATVLSSLAPWKACQQINIENGDAYSKVMKVEAHLRILQLTAITH